MTVSEAAERWQVSEQYIRRLIKQGRVKAKRVFIRHIWHWEIANDHPSPKSDKPDSN